MYANLMKLMKTDSHSLQQFNEIATAIQQEVVHRAHNTAKCTYLILQGRPSMTMSFSVAYNNLLSQVIREDVDRDAKLLKLRRFLEVRCTIMSSSATVLRAVCYIARPNQHEGRQHSSCYSNLAKAEHSQVFGRGLRCSSWPVWV